MYVKKYNWSPGHDFTDVIAQSIYLLILFNKHLQSASYTPGALLATL